tara:strand:- start:879 stop:1463 length:585 start_codon:yes stop_codon:yes gene_type:complete
MASEIQLFDIEGNRLYLNGEERQAFVAAAEEERHEVRTFCLTLHHAGVRISEALELVPSKVDISEQVIMIRTLKRRKTHWRAIPVPQDYIDTLDLVHRVREAQKAKNDAPLWPWSRQHAWRLVKGVMTKAGLDITQPHATPKGLRHGFGISALTKDVPLPIVQKMMGHADIKTTAIYMNAVGVEQRDFASRMWT